MKKRTLLIISPIIAMFLGATVATNINTTNINKSVVAHAEGEGISYISRSWDGDNVVENSSVCNDYQTLNSFTTQWNDGNWYVANSSFTISSRVTISGTVNLILCDGVTLTANNGIRTTDAILNIYSQSGGSGSLIASTSTNTYSAIGGQSGNVNGGTVNIYGGNITATSGYGAAGIGGGQWGDGGEVTIYGGNITATGGNGGAGIGSGSKNSVTPSNSKVIVYGGSVTANGGSGASGISGGARATGGEVSVYGGTIIANAGGTGAGIGGGTGADGGIVNIYGGSVTANGGASGGSGVGGGSSGKGGEVSVYGGTLTAQGGERGAGIGGGDRADGGIFNMYGGTVNVNKSDNTSVGCGIGPGRDYAATNPKGGTIVISGGTLTAYGGTFSAAIGGGYSGLGGDITISGGEVHAYGGAQAAGIGNGQAGKEVNINISGGTIISQGGNSGAGIGGGYNAGGLNITVSGGTIIATGGQYASGVGGGQSSGYATSDDTATAGTIIITGGNVTGIAGDSGIYTTKKAEGIGNGCGYTKDTTISVGDGLTVLGSDEGTPSEDDEYTDYGNTRYQYMTIKHVHHWSYSKASEDSISVICTTDNCPAEEGLLLTLATEDFNYDGNAKTASFVPGYDIEAFPNPIINYYQNDILIDECINVGTYEARVTFGGVTATKSFTISKVDPSYTLPTGIKGMSDQKLSEIELPEHWSWANPDALVGDGKDVDIIYTPEDEVNYNIINKKIDIEATQHVGYRAWNGTSVADVEGGCLEFTIISKESTSLTSGWYVVNSDVTIPTRITVTGEVHLILVDGCTLTANEGIAVNEGNTLSIYGQSLSTGKLVATSNDNANAVIGGDAEVNSGTINIHGGIIEATASSESDGAAIGGGYSASAGVINVYGGTVNAVGNAKANAIGKGVEGISDGTLNVANNLVVLGNNESSPTYPIDEKIDYASNRYKYMTIGTFVTGEKVTYGLYIGDVEVSNYNLLINSVDSSDIKNGSAVFDPETYTLTLTNFEYIGSGFSGSGWEAGVIDYKGNKDLTINIVGTNKIHKLDSSTSCSHGIFYGETNLTIKGTGSLHISFSEDRRGSKSNGIFTESGFFTMESGTVEVYAGIGDESAAIYTGSGITFNGGYFKGVGNTTTAYESRGIYSHGSITINGGKVLGYAPLVHNKEAYGFHGSVTIKGGEVIAYSQNPFSSGVSIKVPAAIYAGADENSLAKYGYIPSSEKYIYINAGHQHNFKYTTDGASITAECQEENCNVTSGLTLTLEAPTNLVYDGTAKSISFAPGYSAEAFATPTISYYKDGVEVEECIDVGTYEARVTFGEATAKITFTITQATPTGYDIPGGLQATYGDDLSSVNLPTNWNWKNPNDKVGNAGINNHIAIYTPSDNNYKSVEEELVIGVSKANPIVPIIYDMEVPYDVELSTIGLPSGFSWMDPTLRTNKWGNNLFHVRYTPTDTANYNEVDFVNVTLNVKWILVDPTIGDVSVIINDQDESFTVNINVKVEVKTEITVDEKRDNYSSLADYGLVNSNEDITAIYDVKLIRTTNGVEEEIQPSDIKEGTKITVSMAIPEELVGKDFRLVHIHNANDISEVTDYAISKDGKTLSVEVDRLSEFAFIGATDVDNGFIYNVTPIWAIILLIIFGIILLVGVYVLYRLIKDRNDNSNNGNNKSVKAMSISFIAPLFIVLSAVNGVVVAFIVVAILAVLVWGANLTLFLLRKKRNENIVNKVEAVSSSTSNDEEEEEESVTITDEKGNIFNIRYVKSFTAKLIQSSDETKKYYEELKNEVLSYKSTHSRISWHYDSVNAGRNQVLKFAVRGKTLCVYLPLNADNYLDSKYKVEKSESKKYEEVPCLYRIKNDRRLGYAKELIAVAAANLGLTKGEEQHEIYSNLPYEPNKPLIERGLIKELKVQVNKPATQVVDSKINADGDEIITTKDDKGNIFEIRFVKSFTAKLIQSSDETKKYYEELKNEVLSYKSTHSRVSWHYDSINAGRNYVLRFVIRGKTLCVYLPLNADDYLDSKYKVEKSESKKYEEVPCLYRIKNDRRLGYAKELIAVVASNLGLVKGEEQHEVYSNLPYEPNKPLIERGLIKELKTKIVDKEVIEKYESITVEKADKAMTDEKAETFIEEINVEKARHGKKEIINIDTLSEHFNDGDEVTIDSLIDKKLIHSSTGHVKVLARGSLNKKLDVKLNDYSIQAVKMILLMGGHVKKIK